MTRGYINSHARIKVNPLELGLVGGWDMKQDVAGTVFDKSGGGYDGTISGSLQQKSCLLGDYLRCPSVGMTDHFIEVDGGEVAGGEFTYAFWVKSETSSGNQTVISETHATLTNQRLQIRSGWASSTRLSAVLIDDANNAISVDEPATGTFGDQLWHHYVITRDGTNLKMYLDGDLVDTQADAAIGTTTLNKRSFFAYQIGGSHALSFQGGLMGVECLDFAQDAAWAAQQYALGKTALFQTMPPNNTGTVTSGNIGDSPLVVDSGGFAVVDDSEVGKAIECITAGVCYVPTSLFQQTPTEAARGHLEFWCYKASTASDVNVQFIGETNGGTYSTGQYGYALSFNTDERIVLREVANGVASNLMYTAVDTVPIAQWFKIGIDMSSITGFGIYLNDSLVTADFGTNPIIDTTYTESMYITSDKDAGDKIALGSLNGNNSIIKRLLS